MKTWGFCFLTLAVTSPAASKEPTDAALVKFAQERTNAVRITETPFRMHELAAILCRMPPEELRIQKKEQALKRPLRNPHREKFVHVFVSPEGATAMRTHSAAFPRGAIVLKEKFTDSKAGHAEMFTGMVKREAGYNPECGDWEFFVLDADISKVIERGRLQRCIDCHVEYKGRDFVTKNYVSRSQSGK